MRSATFPASWVPKRRPVDVRAVASDYFTRGTLDPRPRVMSADAWLPANHAHNIPEIIEQAATVPACGAVISLLWIPHTCEPARAVCT